VRPFSLEQLDERLSALARQPPGESDLPFEERSTSRFGGGLLGRLIHKEEAEVVTAAGGVASSYRGFLAAVPPTDGVAERAGKDVIEAQLAAESAAPRHPRPDPSGAGNDSHVQRQKPQIHPRFRSGNVVADPVDLPLTSALRRLRALMEELEAMVDERPELLDRRMLADRVAEEIERELRPDATTVWVPREDKTYEAYATRGLDATVGIRVPQEQSLFLSFRTDVDAVLISPLDVSQRPVSGIPGLLGESLVASAVRLDQTLVGIVVATGTGFSVTDRDRLAFLSSRAAPDFALAWLIEHLLGRRFVLPLETTEGSL
ncbi:MAG: hypothetical protein M3252_00995, partial [Actinomycetota bacterium]|nr:hypothetical protein [Actinomycetota bacterium]